MQEREDCLNSLDGKLGKIVFRENRITGVRVILTFGNVSSFANNIGSSDFPTFKYVCIKKSPRAFTGLAQRVQSDRFACKVGQR